MTRRSSRSARLLNQCGAQPFRRELIQRSVFEVLETRTLFSTWTVTSLLDNGSSGTLRSVIGSAEASSGSQTIQFDPSLTSTGPATISLNGTALDISGGTLTIQGPVGANGISLDAQNDSGVLAVGSGATVALNNLTLKHGSDASGGGVNVAGSLTLNNSTITGNTATQGGGIYQDGSGLLTINDSTITANQSSWDGAGIMGSNVTVTGSTISNNISSSYGGGIAVTGTLALTASTVSGNVGDLGVGGIVTEDAATSITISTSTFALNVGDIGSAIDTCCDTTINDSTIDDNFSPDSGTAVNSYGGLVILQGSIISDNTADLSGYLGLTDDLVGDTFFGTAALTIPYSASANESIIWGTSADLAPLGNYGGPTQTMPPLPGSPAIDSYQYWGDLPARAATDQRGFPLQYDLGAFQIQSPTTTGVNPLSVNTTSDDPTASGYLSLRDAVNLADLTGGYQTITFDSSLTATSNAIINLTSPISLDDTTGTLTVDPTGTYGVTINPAAAGASALAVASGSSATLEGVAVNGTINVSGQFSFTGTTLTSASGITIASGGVVTANGVTGGGVTVQDGAIFKINGSTTLPSLTIDAGGVAEQVSTNTTFGASVITLGSLTIDSPFGSTNGGVLDLGNGDLIVRSTAVSGLQPLLAAGYDGGFWDGEASSGPNPAAILSSTAANDPYGIESLGYIHIGTGSSDFNISSYDGQSVSSGDTVVALTYYGDANLDRTINGSDYALIDNGFNMGLTGWTNGDFNFDYNVDGIDYGLINRSSTLLGFNLTNPFADGPGEVTIPATTTLETGNVVIVDCPPVVKFATQGFTPWLYTAAPPNGPVVSVSLPATCPFIVVSPPGPNVTVNNQGYGFITVGVFPGTPKGVYLTHVYLYTGSPATYIATITVKVTVK
jgi:hypothetical protein